MSNDRVRPFARSLVCQIKAIADLSTGSTANLNKTERCLIEGALNEAARRLRFVRSGWRDDRQKIGSQREPIFWEDIVDGGAA